MSDQIFKLINEWIRNKKTGKIVINFFKGGISSISKEEMMKLSTICEDQDYEVR